MTYINIYNSCIIVANNCNNNKLLLRDNQSGYSEAPIGAVKFPLLYRKVLRVHSFLPASTCEQHDLGRPDFTGMGKCLHLCWLDVSGSLGQEVPVLLAGNDCSLPWHLLPFSRSTVIWGVNAPIPLQWRNSKKTKKHCLGQFCFALQKNHRQ